MSALSPLVLRLIGYDAPDFIFAATGILAYCLAYAFRECPPRPAIIATISRRLQSLAISLSLPAGHGTSSPGDLLLALFSVL